MSLSTSKQVDIKRQESELQGNIFGEEIEKNLADLWLLAYHDQLPWPYRHCFAGREYSKTNYRTA